eukprot:1053416-Pelagomonas_calceolata.AAC.3
MSRQGFQSFKGRCAEGGRCWPNKSQRSNGSSRAPQGAAPTPALHCRLRDKCRGAVHSRMLLVRGHLPVQGTDCKVPRRVAAAIRMKA